ncbi:MAG: RIP metalloprotease RseP, partial [Gramella sp.]|nr:RIP metalloprotease RseP [Christiangramia sp.]
MDPFLVKAIQLILSLSFLIVLHELGHFIPAKLFKTRVEKFFLFFDVKFALFKKKIGGTVYGIGWLPLGGYVKIAGMIDESMDKEQMALPPKEWEFRSKPAWQRLIIMLGGVTVNLVLGFLIYMMIMFVWGTAYVGPEEMPEGFAVVDTFKEYGFEDGDKILEVNGKEFENSLDINKHLFMRDVNNITVLHQDGSKETISVPEEIGTQMFEQGIMQPFVPINQPVLDTVVAEMAAAKGGLKKGDSIISLNNTEIGYWHEIAPVSMENKQQPVEVVYKRDGKIMSTTVEPDEDGKLGILPMTVIEIKRKSYGFVQSISKGFDYGYWTLRDYVY